MCSRDELQVIEQIVKEKDELALYTNLSRRVEPAATTLTETFVEGESFEQRGLAWLTALARVELGAMLAGFTEREHPFATVPPTPYDLAQYKEIMLDSLRTHYNALRNDPVAQFYWSYRDKLVTIQDRVRGRREINEPQAVAYASRVSLTASFIEAIRDLGRFELAPVQVAQLASWDKELDTLGETIYKKVLGLGSTALNTGGTSTKNFNTDTGWRSGCRALTVNARAKARNPANVNILRQQ